MVFYYSPAQSGSPDSTFNGNGILMTSTTAANGIIAVQPDGKVIIGKGYFDKNFKFILISRIKVDGTPDSSFGLNGDVPGNLDSNYSTLNVVKICPDGKIITLGTKSSGVYVLSRYLPDGGIDSSLDHDGILNLDYSGTSPVILVAGIQDDGKILLAGNQSSQQSSGFLIIRLNSDGSLDNSFGSSGMVQTIFSVHISNDSIGLFYRDNADAIDLVIQKDGKILAVGTETSSLNDFNGDSIAIARYNPDGSLDNTFNKNGKLTLNPPNINSPAANTYGSLASSIALQTDGKIIVGGCFSYSQSHGRWLYGDFGLIRFQTNGTLDSSFNGTGIKDAGGAGLSAVTNKVALQSDGKIILGGTIGDVDHTSYYRITLMRINNDGSDDVTFGQGGRISPVFTDTANNNNVLNSGMTGMELKGQRIYVTSSQQIGSAISAYKNDGTCLQLIAMDLCPPSANASIQTDLPGTNYQWQLSTDSVHFNNISNNSFYTGANTKTLSLINIPLLWQGYQYRCTVTNGISNVTTIQFLSGNENEWSGALSNTWEVSGNWLCGVVPGKTSNVLIAKGSVVIHSNISINSLQLKPGASLTVGTGYSLTITR